MRRFLLLCAISFFTLGACANKAPKAVYLLSEDPCDAESRHQLIGFKSISGTSGNMNISMIMLLPCKGGNPATFSLAFYNADDLKQPTNLTNAKFSWSIFSGNASCEDPSKNNAIITDKIETQPDLKILSQGAAITLGVGVKHPNRLFPYYIKVPFDNEGVVGLPHKNNPGGCIEGANLSPFVPDMATLSPVYQNGRSVSSEAGEIATSLDAYPYQLARGGAPLFTFGTKQAPAGSNGGIKSSVGHSTDGSLFTFDVKLKPGRYYVALSLVPNPMASAMSGDFSLKDVKIYGNSGDVHNVLDYLADCNKDVSCGGKATIINVS